MLCKSFMSLLCKPCTIVLQTFAPLVGILCNVMSHHADGGIGTHLIGVLPCGAKRQLSISVVIHLAQRVLTLSPFLIASTTGWQIATRLVRPFSSNPPASPEGCCWDNCGASRKAKQTQRQRSGEHQVHSETALDIMK